ncbi:MAG: type II secretion system protein [Phycisphaerales bacterium]
MRIHTAHKRRAFTLIETVISLTIVTVLFVGLSGAVMIGTHALPTAKDTGLADQEVIDALNMFREDLRRAKDIHYRTDASDIELKLDMVKTGADGEYDHVTYLYDSSTNSLTREPKDGAVDTLFGNISGFSVQFTMDDKYVVVLQALISVKETIQPIFEVHALLPYKPELH